MSMLRARPASRSTEFLSFSFRSTQKILHHARLAERGLIARDPMKEAIGLELDMLNILYVSSLSLPMFSKVSPCPVFASFKSLLCRTIGESSL
jgi:hypothetical protein